MVCLTKEATVGCYEPRLCHLLQRRHRLLLRSVPAQLGYLVTGLCSGMVSRSCHPLSEVLFNFPLRYLSAIGSVVVFSLRRSLPPALRCMIRQRDSRRQDMPCSTHYQQVRWGLHPLWTCNRQVRHSECRHVMERAKPPSFTSDTAM